ncbi:MAG: histidine--tRNA ligase [Candidatus Bipolaricaulota bacterium]|nr:histidine--tRNA ligase [Candidatus Bipolaricaulota bacterium]MCS7274131.1 histidine--tRNA ligase [Candidatus Bipolaricaulota bacterium]MDW8111304.1 histidine--tRNA ligase [Candidatus Bipolaricaulota bacterium]MDW8328560.1 histidine--tRNA ligase [Candidatus Bipolaricaulota bacterium]
MELQLPRGMRDFPPEEKILRDDVIATLKEIFELYGFSPLETPVVERWEVLSAKYSGGEEILKETFRLTDQGGRDLGLRYDLTVPLARFVGMNPTIKRPFKRYQIGTVYRDGPIKKGRTREFYQCDADIVGSSSPLADAECVQLALDVFERLGIEVIVKINNRKILSEMARMAGVPEALTDAAILSLDKLEKIGTEGVLREMVERGLTQESAERFLSGAQDPEALKNSAGYHELEPVLTFLQAPRVVWTPSLARGLSYYTGTIYEVYAKESSVTGSLAAGGRYDNMIGQFLESTEKIPAVGISFGLEPILEVLKEQRRDLPMRKTVTQVYVIPFKNLLLEGRRVCQQLRRAGIRTDIDFGAKGISDGLKYANAYDIPFVVIVGPDEVAQDKVKLRDMRSGEEQLFTVEALIEKLSHKS